MDQRIRRQFGPAVARTLARCPTAVADLAQIRAAGVSIRRFDGPRNSAFAAAACRTIYISKRSSIGRVIMHLCHEKVHVLDSPTADPVLTGMTRKQFVKHGLESELDAIEHESEVVSELLNIGYRYIGEHKSELHRRAKEGRGSLRRWLETVTTSTNGATYREYYGDWYDDSCDE